MLEIGFRALHLLDLLGKRTTLVASSSTIGESRAGRSVIGFAFLVASLHHYCMILEYVARLLGYAYLPTYPPTLGTYHT